MKAEDLETINSDLFQALDLADQQYIVGQTTYASTIDYTNTPTGHDFRDDFSVDWS